MRGCEFAPPWRDNTISKAKDNEHNQILIKALDDVSYALGYNDREDYIDDCFRDVIKERWERFLEGQKS